MSRVYFHSPSGDVELLGMERARLGFLARGPAESAWGWHQRGTALDHSQMLMDLVIDNSPLKGQLVDVLEDPNDSRRYYQFIQMMRSYMNVYGFDIMVAGYVLHTYEIELNTALLAGSDPIALAAKIHGTCESHGWVEGPDRMWLADIIQRGLSSGIYRQDMGWDDVLTLLLDRRDEPVVMSYSVGDLFPHKNLTQWEPDADDPDGARWYDLSAEDQWDGSMARLREGGAFRRLSPESLHEQYFDVPVTVYDLLAPNRDERVRRAKTY